MAPAAMLNKPTVHPGAVIGGGAPVYAAQPVLRGIINNGVKQLAIIEFNNTSNYYKVSKLLAIILLPLSASILLT